MNQDGLKIKEVSNLEFREFAKRFATSPEVGPIQTSLDGGVEKDGDYDRVLVGLWGCDNLCAVACFHLYQSAMDKTRHVLKLDSVVVDPALRRRGLGSVVVARAFTDLVMGGVFKISRIYAHSVHPATVRLLRRLGFNNPQITGAPISDFSFETGNEAAFVDVCEKQLQSQISQMRLQCEFCRKGDKRARPWCLPRGKKPNFR